MTDMKAHEQILYNFGFAVNLGDAYYDETDTAGKFMEVSKSGKYYGTMWYDENARFRYILSLS